MRERLERTSPVPLYHQIAEAVRNAIAVGDLKPGERLAPVREAAGQWGVNLHTVRKAYGALEREGLVRIAGARGTEVTGGGARGADGELAAFVAGVAEAARARFGLSAAGLASLLLRGSAAEEAPVVHFVECSREQARGHCEELERSWWVRAHPVVLSEAVELPAGAVVATYFHYNDIRQRWPHRLEEVRFVAIAPAADLVDRLPRGRAGSPRRLLVCEHDAAKAANIAADVRALVPADRFVVEPRVVKPAGPLPRTRGGDVALVSPRVWGGLPERQRARVVPIRYSIRSHELEALGTSLGWRRASTGDGE